MTFSGASTLGSVLNHDTEPVLLRYCRSCAYKHMRLRYILA
jgi:hypothetical protein